MTTNDYLIYADEKGEYGYAKKSFYDGSRDLMNHIKILKTNLSQQSAEKIVNSLNKSFPKSSF
jgi:hypothetical protein